jgi:hypothetical protein
MISFDKEKIRSEADYLAWSRRERDRLSGDPAELRAAVKSSRFFWLAPDDRAALLELGGQHPPGIMTVVAPRGHRIPQELGTRGIGVGGRRKSSFSPAFRRALRSGVEVCATTVMIGMVASFCLKIAVEIMA